MNVETAQRLADLRRSKGFSQEGLARKLGLSRQAVSKWERAESSPDTENLISLAKLYGVSLDELLNPSDEIEDDIEFENEDRARQREAEAAERARTHEAAARATEAATQASDAAAKAAQAASWRAQAANADGAGDGRRRGRSDSGEGPLPVVPVLGRVLAAVLFADAPGWCQPFSRTDLLYDSHLSLGGACARWRLGARGYPGWSGAGGGQGPGEGYFCGT